MLINAYTRIKDLLDFNQEEVINTLIKLNKNFSKLKNPLLRNLFARRITIADACKIANCPISAFMSSMQQIGFVVDPQKINEQKISTEPFKKYAHIIELDVRPVLAKNQDPLKTILDHINKLEAGQRLKLINTFEPIPLIHLLAEKGFCSHTEFTANEIVYTYFEKDSTTDQKIVETHPAILLNNEDKFDETLTKFTPNHIKYIDVRALEMPKPMLLIIEHIKTLALGEALFVYHKRKPIYLLPELEKSGFKYLFKETLPGDVNMLIYKL